MKSQMVGTPQHSPLPLNNVRQVSSLLLTNLIAFNVQMALSTLKTEASVKNAPTLHTQMKIERLA